MHIFAQFQIEKNMTHLQRGQGAERRPLSRATHNRGWQASHLVASSKAWSMSVAMLFGSLL